MHMHNIGYSITNALINGKLVNTIKETEFLVLQLDNEKFLVVVLVVIELHIQRIIKIVILYEPATRRYNTSNYMGLNLLILSFEVISTENKQMTEER